jgi:hypothetical protein
MEAPGVPTGSVRGRKGKEEGKVGAGEGPRPCRRQKKLVWVRVGESCGEGEDEG